MHGDDTRNNGEVHAEAHGGDKEDDGDGAKPGGDDKEARGGEDSSHSPLSW